ncbi:hypothetical protein ACM9HF_04585 [Colwellia sp. RE-S-Sl-9]
MKAAIFVFLIGVSLLLYSFILEPYSDPELFNQQYMSLDNSQSAEFYALREEMLTPKYLLQDLGITIISFLFILMLLLKLGKGKIKTPNKPLLILLAFTLPFITAAGSVFDLFQGLFRGEFPHWADSIGIPLSGIPIIFIVLFIWSMLHLLFISIGQTPVTKVKITPLPISSSLSFKLNPWIIFVSFITIILTCLSTVYGQYWVSVPGVFWLYYYLSIGAIRLEAKCT